MISPDNPSFAHGFFRRATEFTYGLARYLQCLIMISTDHPSFVHGFFMRAIKFAHGLARKSSEFGNNFFWSSLFCLWFLYESYRVYPWFIMEIFIAISASYLGEKPSLPMV